MDSYKVVIVGGGPSGMMAAIRAAQLTDGVVLFEKNASLGRKLGLTGKGRCNMTNTSSLEETLEKFGKNGAFLRDSFSRFFVQDLTAFFETRGLKVKTERQGRVFPETDSSKSVLDVLRRALVQEGVEIHLSSPVRTLAAGEDELIFVHLKNGQKVRGRKVIIATGGISYPETGSSGDGFRMAAELGHKVLPAIPGLVPLETEEAFVKELQGLTLKNIKISFQAGSKKIESSVGELLFTHFGVSGPLVLDLSSDVNSLSKRNETVTMRIDLKPGLSQEQLDKKLQHEFQKAGALKLKNYLSGLLPRRFIDIFLRSSKIDEEEKCPQVTAEQRKRMLELFKRFPLTVKGPRPISEAMVTVGGISLKEIDPKTMESRKIKGVYFCGEVLDIAAPSGGFNLQAAFSTGYAAGESAALNL